MPKSALAEKRFHARRGHLGGSICCHLREQPYTARDASLSSPLQDHQCQLVHVLAWTGCARNALTDWQVMT